MNWKKWKAGLFVAILTGFAAGLVGACAGFAIHLTGAQLVELFVVNFGLNVGKDLLLYLKNHPIEEVNFETQHITRDTHQEITIKGPPSNV
jgi:tetrahydromethanopterin S-methyltransferase subunit F